MKAFLLDGILFEVTKKPIKNMYLRVRSSQDAVQITASHSFTESQIKAFALSRMDWVRLQRQKLASRPASILISAQSTVSLWGQIYPLILRPFSKKTDAQYENGIVTLYMRDEITDENCQKALCLLYKKALLEALPQAIARCELRCNLHAKAWRLRNMRSRWGSCNVREARICLNLQLAAKPPECLAYVITHELCHLLEKGHNARFYGLMDCFFPDWRSVKARLNA